MIAWLGWNKCQSGINIPCRIYSSPVTSFFTLKVWLRLFRFGANCIFCFILGRPGPSFPIDKRVVAVVVRLRPIFLFFPRMCSHSLLATGQ